MEEKGWKLGPPFLILFKAEEMSHSVRAHARAPPTSALTRAYAPHLCSHTRVRPPTYRASSRARRADT